MAVDWGDPCARAAALRDAYYTLVSGQATASFRYQGNGTIREVTYSLANREALYQEWQNAERQCSSGQRKPMVRTIRLAPTKGV